ncbi:MAG: hypothetical protein PHS74_09295 [Lachnospiraceae bacterium]|nr:hypothetical protein [Lachnospiraceae bacterium]
MLQIKELVEVDRRFQSSINLQLDLQNQKKIDGYIATKSSQIIMDHYLDNVNEGKEKATILIGPYGKGKSHLLLVLLNMLRNRERPFLPVIVSGGYENLNQAFFMGMIDALKREKLENIIPDSYYSKAIEKIVEWEKKFPDAYHLFQQEIEKLHWDEDDFIAQLNRFNEKVLKEFQKIYSKITFGAKFQPLVDTLAEVLYKEINAKLYDVYGYDGIFIVFDEFSKYVEGHDKETFSRDMRTLQEMCELANSSSRPQLHLSLVVHKSIKEYGGILPKEIIDAFTGVEGRINEIKFIVSSQNNYELLARVLQKKDKQAEEKIEHIKPYYANAIDSQQLQCFEALFEKADFERILVKGCFPLMPLTAYLLLLISEKVAQNERSIFTYLSSDEKGSLYRLI